MDNNINNKKKIILSIALVLLLVVATVGITYAFFNYTRTGSANTLNTGRIYFSTEQTNQNTITLNNIFPMTKEQALADSSTNGTLVVTFNGDTTYTDGMEYLLSIDSVSGTTNVPISLIMDVNITENSVAVAENSNYYTAREAKTTSMYIAEGVDTTINSTTHKVITDVKTGKYLLAGYIKSGEYGISGSITIKAFIDADNILITDTPDDQSQRPSTAYTDGTDTTGKTVISTTDWNALQSSGITFKVKGEAREGIWVTVPPFRGTATQLANSASEYELETTPYGKIYTGSNPNNYVWFNDEQWRIIGVYDNQLKIVKATPLAEARAYDADSNVWEGSDLETYLNQEIEGGYYYSLSETAKDMIVAGTWDAGKVQQNKNANATYLQAINRKVTNKNVGLVAAYEYLYAAENDGICWTTDQYSSNSCAEKNWFPISWWTLNPEYWSSNKVIFPINKGYMNAHEVTREHYVLPAVYLDSSVRITGGSGQSGEANSYKLG